MADEQEEVERLYSEWKRETLEELRLTLVRDIEPRKFFPFLRSKQVLDEDDEEEIQAEKTRKQRAESFLTILAKKGHHGFDSFCEALLQSAGQLHLLKAILDNFDEKRQGASDLYHRRELPPLKFSEDFPAPGQPGGPELPLGYALVMHEPPPAYELINSLQ